MQYPVTEPRLAGVERREAARQRSDGAGKVRRVFVVKHFLFNVAVVAMQIETFLQLRFGPWHIFQKFQNKYDKRK